MTPAARRYFDNIRFHPSDGAEFFSAWGSISYVKVDDFEQVHESFTGKVVQEQIYKGFKAKLGEVLPTFTKEYNGELETEPKLTTSRITLITLRAKQLEVRLWIGLMVNYAWKMKMPVELTDTVVPVAEMVCH
ncbi:hypothetical protein HPK02_15370 [Anoxybacillus flavithermus]|nr:hypothetical protein [Anoxybacillus flavithermus]